MNEIVKFAIYGVLLFTALLIIASALGWRVGREVECRTVPVRVEAYGRKKRRVS